MLVRCISLEILRTQKSYGELKWDMGHLRDTQSQRLVLGIELDTVLPDHKVTLHPTDSISLLHITCHLSVSLVHKLLNFIFVCRTFIRNLPTFWLIVKSENLNNMIPSSAENSSKINVLKSAALAQIHKIEGNKLLRSKQCS